MSEDVVVKAVKNLVTNVEKVHDSLSKRVDEIEYRFDREHFSRYVPREGEQRSKAFLNFVRLGREAMLPEEAQCLVQSDDTRGGVNAPEEFVAELLKNIVQFSPVRQAARVGRTSSGSVKLPRRTARLTATWVGETETRSATEPSYGSVTIPINEAACYIDVSNSLLEDSAIDLAQELAVDLAEEFGRLEGLAFTRGSGVKQPFGYLSDPEVPQVASGSTTELDADAFIDLYYSLAPAYRRNAVFMMNGTTLSAVRKLKSSGGGDYIWSPSIAPGQPETLLGRPVIEAIDMDDIEASAFPVALGDFSSAYRIYDRIALSIMRDPYSIALNGQVRFHARRRVGGSVVKPEAIRKMKIATS